MAANFLGIIRCIHNQRIVEEARLIRAEISLKSAILRCDIFTTSSSVPQYRGTAAAGISLTDVTGPPTAVRPPARDGSPPW